MIEKRLPRYELSPAADDDLSDIYDYTTDEYGVKQAATYLQEIDGKCKQLLENPEIGRNRDEIKHSLRSIQCNQHVIFYRIMDSCIRIVRVLHIRSDYHSHLP